MTIFQLNPPLPISTPKGNGVAWLVINEGVEHNLQWVVAIDTTGEVWTFDNTKVRAQKNITMGRIFNECKTAHHCDILCVFPCVLAG